MRVVVLSVCVILVAAACSGGPPPSASLPDSPATPETLEGATATPAQTAERSSTPTTMRTVKVAAPAASSATPEAAPHAVEQAPARPEAQRVGADCVPPVLEQHPLRLAPFDPATGLAGDVAFRRGTQFDLVFMEFGFVIPGAQSATGADKANPQPTYLAPTGTPVRAPVNGVVDRVSELWSTSTLGDVSVMVRPDGLEAGCYVVVELEHVVGVRVAVGERVAAGQALAEVGPLSTEWNGGLGLVELGVLTGDGKGGPLHVCPYAYFTPGAAEELAALERLMSDWESFSGNPDAYDEDRWVDGVPGCRAGPMSE